MKWKNFKSFPLRNLFLNGLFTQCLWISIVFTAVAASPYAEDNILISGKVVDPDGEPLPGVSILVQGTATGTTSDINGEYKLTVAGGSTLVFSYVGYISQTIEVGNQSVLNITLEPDLTQLDEVVVVGYGEQSRATITGAVSRMDSKDIKKIPASNLSSLMAGRIAGVYVDNWTGTPGTSSNIRVRAKDSFNDNPPLFVIDGIVREKRAFDALDPSEIKEISVLKDAASAAVYGVKASGGVILVTTERGQSGKAQINYTATFSSEKPTQLPDMMSAVDIARLANSYLPETDNNYWTEEEIAHIKTVNNGYGYDNLNEVYKTPTSKRHALSIKGGSDKIQYYLGGSLYGQTGFLDPLTYNKNTLRGNIRAQLTEDLSVSLNMSNINTKRNKYYWTYDWDGDDLSDLWKKLQTWQPYIPFFSEEGKPLDLGWLGNVAELINNSGYRRYKEQIQSNIITLEYKVPFVKGLRLKGSYAFEKYNRQQKLFAKKHLLYISEPNQGKIYSRKLTGGTTMSGHPSTEFLYTQNISNSSYQLNLQADYERSFGKHNLAATFVYEQREWENGDTYGNRDRFPILVRDQYFATSGDRTDSYVGGSESEGGQLAYVGRVNYDYAKKYLLSASFRYDGNYLFAPGHQYGFFPAVSAGWRISEEPFFNLGFLEELKVRASMGTLGNDRINGDQIAAFLWQETYRPDDGFYFGENPKETKGVWYGGNKNRSVTWEKSRTWNAGLDVEFSNGISFTTEYWFKRTFDILRGRQVTVPTTFGANLPPENYGIVNSNGFEFELAYERTTASGLNYYVSGNFAFGKNKVVEIDVKENAQDWENPVGKPLGRITGWEYDGIIRTQADLDALPDDWRIFGHTPQLGMANYKDLSGPDGKPDGKIDGYDQTILHNYSSAPVSYGLTLGSFWKGFSIELFFQGMAGHQKQIVAQDPYPHTRIYSIWEDYWSADNPNASMPSPNIAWTGTYNRTSGLWLRNASFVRLKNINVSYSLPKKLTGKAGLQDIQLFFNATNLFHLSKFKTYDPEVKHAGVYPNMKNFSGGISVTL
ncbi:TonB-dependent receptor [Rapidithrix thailandica]|uniref:TonB-dependent receptor n=1 Tax=Rapidithrix thailandica TaxID=413964 RepID=A0AAW9SAR0_9BACT